MSESIVTVSNIVKRYRKGVTALDGVSLTLDRGRIYGLIGNNGAGKTTLLRLLTGLAAATEGEITLFGSTSKEAFRTARGRVGALVESPAYYGDLSIEQNLHAYAILKGNITSREQKELLEELEISSRQVGKRMTRHCSMGQKQRLGIAFALLGDPELLILDEPMNGLDPSGVIQLRGILSERNQKRNTTMLISSHQLTELNTLATDYIILHRGKVLEIIDSSSLEKRMSQMGCTKLEEYFVSVIGKENL